MSDGTEELTVEECERRLRAGAIGIVALPGSAAPVLRPVNFVYEGDCVLIRTGEGQILEAASASEFASFVVFAADRFEHAGWSVVVTGRLRERPDLAGASAPRPWARAEKDHLVALSVHELSGRRLSENVETA